MVKKILVVAAHPDDEVLGCGGTIARHAAEGDVVHVIFMADGVSSRKTSNKDDLLKRNESAENSGKVLGIYKNYYLGWQDNRMDTVPFLEIVKKLEDLVIEISPEIIYTHHHGDLNIDHKITSQAVVTACRPIPSTSVKEIYTFEVLSSTEWARHNLEYFQPQYFVDITPYMELKLAAIENYSHEMREPPHSRSKANIEALAIYRGHSIGVQRAEAFVLVRKLH